MTVSIVVAASANDVIGRDGALPWHLPADLRRFRALTTGHVVVMGRLTHESIIGRLGHPLRDRTSIVVSQTLPGTTGLAGARLGADGEPLPADDDGVLVADSIESALATAAGLAAAAGDDEFFVLGGGSVYRQALPSVERIYLTRVHDEVTGDCHMPAGWLDGFELAAREDAADPTSGTKFSFLDYRRVRA